MYDAIVIGARCGGSPTAMNLARNGHRVLLIDRSHFPSDTLSTHALTGDAIQRLRNWGLLDKICMESGTTVQTSAAWTVNGQSFALPGEISAPRRTVLDAALVEAARKAGAEVREGFSVSHLNRDSDGRVIGITGQHGGATVTEEARVVVGADGRNSFVAREVGAEIYNEQPPLNVGYYSYFNGFPAESSELHFVEDVACFVFPTSNGQTLLASERPFEVFEEWRNDIDAGFRHAFEAVGLGERFAKAERAEEWRGASRMPNYYRKPFGPGWALVGDSGYLKDPVLGQGINDAFRDADTLSEGLDRVFRGEGAFEAEMASYQQQRDAASAMMFAFNYEIAKLKVTPQHVMMALSAPQPA